MYDYVTKDSPMISYVFKLMILGKRRREEDECGYLLLERAGIFYFSYDWYFHIVKYVKKIMQQWIYFIENSEPFHQTAAFHESKHYLEGGGKFLVLSGLWGSGKTKTAKEVHRSVTGNSPTILTDVEKFNNEEKLGSHL